MSNKNFKIGEIVNLMQVDLQRVQLLSIVIPTIILTPYSLIIGIVLMYLQVGSSFYAGFIVLVVMSFFTLFVGVK